MTTHQRWVFAFWVYLGILLTIIISAYLKMLPVKSLTIPFYDTIGHFILIGIAAFLSHLALNKRKINCLNLRIPHAAIIVSLLTLIEECLQKLSPNRSFDLLDLASDLCGIIIFTWLAEKIPDK
jgi:polysaccharide biosynthesis protein VpsQ